MNNCDIQSYFLKLLLSEHRTDPDIVLTGRREVKERKSVTDQDRSFLWYFAQKLLQERSVQMLGALLGI